MGYSEIKQQLSCLLDDKNSLVEEIQNLENSICAKQHQIDIKKHNHSIKLEELRSEEFSKYQQELLEPYTIAIQKEEGKKARLSAARQKKLEEIAKLDYHKKYTDLQNMDETDEIYRQISSRVESFYGPNFTETVYSIIPNTVKNEEDLKRVLFELKGCPKILNHTIDFNLILKKVYDKVGSTKNKEDNNKTIIISLILAFIFLGSFICAYQVILLILFVMMFYSIYKSYIFMKCAYVLKGYKVNAARLQDLIDQFTLSAVNRDKNKVEESYKADVAKINNNISLLQAESEYVLETRAKDFIFNPDSLNKEFDTLLSTLESQITDLRESLVVTEKKRDDINLRVGELQNELALSLENLTGEYTPQTPLNSNELPSEYLFDIVGDEPITFSLPRESTIFFYQKEDDALNFQTLLFLQTIRRISPSLVTFHIHDAKTMCRNFVMYEPESKSDNADWIKLSITDKDIKESIIQCNLDFIALRHTIRLYPDLFEYNKSMLDLENPTEPYNFIFSFNPNQSLYNSQEYLQLVENGHICGYFLFVFLPESVLTDDEDNKTLSDLVNRVGCLYKLSDKNITPFSKIKCLDKLKEKK